MKVLITTLASGWYKQLAPLFEYTAKKCNPDCDVKVFFKEDLFPNHSDKSFGLLRFCIPNSYFKGYDYVYFTDVDFIFLPHKTSIVDYHINLIKKTGQSYSGYRGPYKKRWFKNNTRMAGGAFMAARDWLLRTENSRKKLVKKCVNGIKYREKDEVYLQRITKEAGFRIPNAVGCFVNGERYNKTYRNLHLGDFKSGFGYRYNNLKKMKRSFLFDKNIKKYLRLQKDPRFISLLAEAVKEPEIQKIFSNVDEHIAQRGVCLGS